MPNFQMIINGERVSAEEHFAVRNPATEEVITMCPLATSQDLDNAVAAARRAFKPWSALSDKDRKQKIRELAGVIEANADELATLLSQEQGKPLQGFANMGAYFEVGGAQAWCLATAEMDLPVEIVEDTDQQRVEIHRKPLGVVGSITPWNFPLMIAIWHVIPALRTGNTVVLKPSSLTPLATLRFVELANTILPPGVLNIVTGEGGLGRKISSHPGIDKIVFTGSTGTGINIMKNAADTLKRLTLELGGNDAAIVLPDVDPKIIAPKIFAAAFVNNGQTCAALKRLYVHEDVHDELCEALSEIANSVKTGNGLDADVDFGPVQNREQLDYVCELADDARANGARFLSGGEAMTGPGYYYPITLVANVSDGVRLVDEEPFGPILPIIRYSDVDDAIRRANDSPNGLGGSIWSQNLELAQQLASRLECGTVWINNHAAIQPNVPFGGIKRSGFGVEFSTHGLKEYTSIQSVFISKN